jgi:AcrR family transcriptional regulator
MSAAQLQQASDGRRRVLEAAVACFARHGFHGTSMQEICGEARMSPGALYRYFPSKDAIIEAIAEEERKRNAELLARLEVSENVLGTFFDVGFTFLREATRTGHCALCAEVLTEAQRNPRIREIFERNRTEAYGKLRAALARAQSKGEIEGSLDVDAVTSALMALGDGLIMRMPFEADGMIDRFEPQLRLLIGRMLVPADGNRGS